METTGSGSSSDKLGPGMFCLIASAEPLAQPGESTWPAKRVGKSLPLHAAREEAEQTAEPRAVSKEKAAGRVQRIGHHELHCACPWRTLSGTERAELGWVSSKTRAKAEFKAVGFCRTMFGKVEREGGGRAGMNERNS